MHDHILQIVIAELHPLRCASEPQRRKEDIMRPKHICLSAAGLIAANLLSVTAQAAPLSGGQLKADVAAASNIENAAYRRCWWRHGYRVCRWVGYPYYGDDYGYYGPYYG